MSETHKGEITYADSHRQWEAQPAFGFRQPAPGYDSKVTTSLSWATHSYENESPNTFSPPPSSPAWNQPLLTESSISSCQKYSMPQQSQGHSFYLLFYINLSCFSQPQLPHLPGASGISCCDNPTTGLYVDGFISQLCHIGVHPRLSHCPPLLRSCISV